MTNDELELRSHFERDAEALSRFAHLPAAQQALFRAKLRRANSRRRHIASIVAFVECVTAALVATVLIAIAWRNVAASGVTDSGTTVAMITLVTMLAVGVLAVVLFASRFERSS